MEYACGMKGSEPSSGRLARARRTALSISPAASRTLARSAVLTAATVRRSLSARGRPGPIPRVRADRFRTSSRRRPRLPRPRRPRRRPPPETAAVAEGRAAPMRRSVRRAGRRPAWRGPGSCRRRSAGIGGQRLDGRAVVAGQCAAQGRWKALLRRVVGVGLAVSDEGQDAPALAALAVQLGELAESRARHRPISPMPARRRRSGVPRFPAPCGSCWRGRRPRRPRHGRKECAESAFSLVPARLRGTR